MTGRAWWALSPTGGTPPVLVIEDPGGAGLATSCGQSLPWGVIQHDRLPSRQHHATMSTATVLTCPEAIEVGQAILEAAR